MSDFEASTIAIDDLTGDYQLDPAHTRLGFVARHAMVTKVRGVFHEYEATVHLNADDPTQSSARLVIKVDSIDTGQEQRDAHLRSPDFFDVTNYPDMIFESTSVSKLSDTEYRLIGDLTVKDRTQPLAIDFEYIGSAKDPFGNLRAGFEGKATINRKDWDLTWNAALETGGFLVSDKVILEFDVSALKLTPTA
jgi:polyisoprenoid-binding protein YceI